MTYTIIISKSVQKQIDALPDEIGDRVLQCKHRRDVYRK